MCLVSWCIPHPCIFTVQKLLEACPKFGVAFTPGSMQLPAICMSAWPREDKGLTQFLSCFSCCCLIKSSVFHTTTGCWTESKNIEQMVCEQEGVGRVQVYWHDFTSIFFPFVSRKFHVTSLVKLLENSDNSYQNSTCLSQVFLHIFWSMKPFSWKQQGEEMGRNILCSAMLLRWAATENKLPGKDCSGSLQRATAHLQSMTRGNQEASKTRKGVSLKITIERGNVER